MRSARLPFSIGQSVKSSTLPELPLRVLAQEYDGDSWTISVTDARGGGFWRFPAHELTFADIADEQAEMAQWLGCGVEQMNAKHDKIHLAICKALGVPSQSMRIANGEQLTEHENNLASVEEDCVLMAQKLLCLWNKVA